MNNWVCRRLSILAKLFPIADCHRCSSAAYRLDCLSRSRISISLPRPARPISPDPPCFSHCSRMYSPVSCSLSPVAALLVRCLTVYPAPVRLLIRIVPWELLHGCIGAISPCTKGRLIAAFGHAPRECFTGSLTRPGGIRFPQRSCRHILRAQTCPGLALPHRA